ncbi:hypothetical protein SHIRM173S_07074 [Streptomyces hirsutus]
MSAINPEEPGGETRLSAPPPLPHETPRPSDLRRTSRQYGRHRRTVLAALTAGAVTHGRRPPVHHTPPATPATRTAVSVPGDRRHLPETAGQRPGTDKRNFSFIVELTVESGPPVTVTHISQPYTGLSTTSSPHVPFRTKEGSPRKIVITLRVTECGELPENVGLPFLDVTLRNTRAIRTTASSLGPRYAQDLSTALQVACSNDFR